MTTPKQEPAIIERLLAQEKELKGKKEVGPAAAELPKKNETGVEEASRISDQSQFSIVDSGIHDGNKKVSIHLKSATTSVMDFPPLCGTLLEKLSDYLGEDSVAELTKILDRPVLDSHNVGGSTSNSLLSASLVAHQARKTRDFLQVLIEGLQT